ncbi:MAG: hypothetical protein HY608_06230 [Planctomycetes bacterium]|nr:hypothetical protein [Planctomycetota bacterium]
MRRRAALCIALLLCLLGSFVRPGTAAAEPTPFEEEERRRELEEEAQRRLLAGNRWFHFRDLDWGGWLRSGVFWIEDRPDTSTVASNDIGLRDADLRFWVHWKAADTHEFFVRSKMRYFDYSPGDEPGRIEEDWETLEVDQGYYAWTGRWTGRDGIWKPVEARVQAGRQFLQVGNGIAYNQVNDGVQAVVRYPRWRGTVLAAETDHDDENIDGSEAVARHSRRRFYGAQADYLALGRHSPYLYLLHERDHPDERPNSSREFDYDAIYTGVGSEGEFFHRLVRYQAETIEQRGRSYVRRTTPIRVLSEPIDARAFDGGLTWYPEVRGRPSFGARFAHASGDRDRDSPTITDLGNEPGTDDNGFLGFGYAFTGYAAGFRLANLRMWHASATFRPFDTSSPVWKDMEVGVHYLNFAKDTRQGGISDVRATEPEHEIGYEWASSVNWRPLSDLVVRLRYGRFSARDAYPLDTDRDFFGLTATVLF